MVIMLRIQRHEDDGRRVVLALQGRLVGDWAELLERECAEPIRWGRRIVLDLSEVIFVGRTGLEALARLSKAGVELIGYSPLIAAMLAQEGVVVTRPRARSKR